MPNRYKDIYELLLDLDEKGVNVILSFTKDGEEYWFLNPSEIDFIPNTKENIRWLCSGCFEEQNVTLASLLAGHRILPIKCRGCTMSAKSNGYTNYKFRDLLQKENWEYCDDLSKEIVIKSMDFVNAKCNKGHSVKTTPNKWKNEHRCKFCANDNKRNDAGNVKEEIKKKGFTVSENFNYVSNATIMQVTCSRCKSETEMTLGNIRKNIGGCRECSGKTLFEEMNDFLQEHNKTFKSITVEGKEENHKQFILNEDYITYICNCNYNKPHRTTWRQIKECAKCPNCAQKQREETNIEKYGVDNPAKSKDIQQKKVDAYKEKTGYEYPLQNPIVKDKMVKSNKENHGGVHNFTLPEVRSAAVESHILKYGGPPGSVEIIRDKMKATNQKNLGVDYPFQCKEIHNKIKASNLEKYGNEVFIQSDAGKKLMMKLFGVEYALQNPELLAKQQRASFAFKEYMFPSGKKVEIQGYEHHAINKLLKEGYYEINIFVGVENVPNINYIYEGKNKVYFPDIYIKNNEEERIIEVKSDFTLFKEYEKNRTKFITTSLTYNLEVWVFDNKGKLIANLNKKNDYIFELIDC